MPVAKRRIADETEKPAEDKFITLVQVAMEETLTTHNTMEMKDKNAFFANCIKFIAVKNKVTGEEGDWADE